VLSNLEKPDYTIIKKMLKGDTYAQIAEEAFMSENTVKYRIKRMQKLCNVDNRTSLLNLIVKYCPKFIEEND
jgi:DNA-binding NarL/FixJ family response regulator